MYKFPNLQQLILQRSYVDLSNFAISASVMRDFIEYISKITSFDVSFIYTIQLSAVMDVFMQVFDNSLPNISIIYGHYYFDDRKGLVDYLVFCKKAALFDPPLIGNPPEYKENNRDGLDIYFPSASNPTGNLLHLDLLAHIRDVVQELELNVNSTSLMDDEAYDLFASTIGDNIDNITETCTSLKTFTLYGIDVFNCDPERQIVNETIETMELLHCCIIFEYKY